MNSVIMMLSVLLISTISQHFVRGADQGPLSRKANRAVTKSMSAIPVARRFDAGANPAAFRCAANCDQHLKNITYSNLQFDEEVESTEGHETWAVFDTDIMTGICQAFNETERCLDRCPDSEMKTNLKKKYVIRKFECQESTFVITGDCATTVSDLNFGNCTAGQRYYNLTWASDGTETEQDLKENLKNSCLMMKALFDCSEEMLIDRCGQGAANDWSGWTKKYAEYRKTDLADKGLANLYPRECDSL